MIWISKICSSVVEQVWLVESHITTRRESELLTLVLLLLVAVELPQRLQYQ